VDGAGLVTVELFGIPRQRAGTAELQVAAGTVADVLAALVRACPGLTDVVRDGRPGPHCLLSRDGREFVSDPATVLRPGERVLLLSADAGG
jgi:molybdopterin converting factor small subunit